MNETTVKPYEMNPAEDTVMYGDELREGMWVMPDSVSARSLGFSEDAQIRSQRFFRVTRLRHEPDRAVFIGEWVDGYQKAFRVHHIYAWIVKRENASSAEAEMGEISGEGDPS